MTVFSGINEQLYHLVFPGNMLPGVNREDAVFKLSHLLKTSPYRAIKLVSGKKRYLKRTFTLQQAEKLCAQIIALGVECKLEKPDAINRSKHIDKKEE